MSANKETYYFSHDYNARTDKKIKALLAKHGYLAYGIYWAIIEDLYNNTNVLPTNYECISFDLHTGVDLIKSVLHDFDLFEFDGDNFSSPSVQRRLDARTAKSVKATESINKRWQKYERNTNVIQPPYDGNTLKERKGKEIKEKEKREYQTPALFLKSKIETDLEAEAMKSGLGKEVFEKCLTQWSLSCEAKGWDYSEDDEAGDLKKLRAGFQKWLNTWVERERTPKPRAPVEKKISSTANGFSDNSAYKTAKET